MTDTEFRYHRISNELSHARSSYTFWAQQDGRLTRDEFAQKMAAERTVEELERAKRKAAMALPENHSARKAYK